MAEELTTNSKVEILGFWSLIEAMKKNNNREVQTFDDSQLVTK